MDRAWGAGFRRIARTGLLALVAGGLGACSGSDPIRSRISELAALPASAPAPSNSAVVGDAVPKGGGNYKLGRPYELNGRTYVPAEDPNYRAEGIASWYGPDFHGKPTANGETFDMNGISAAHPTLPMPSYLRVTNLSNGRSIIVRLNDRGPYAKERVVDLSIGAAKALDFYAQGLTRVRVEYVGRAPLGGSDDRMLLATLRHGTQAPVPSLVRVAAAKPVALQSGGTAGRTPAAERAFATPPARAPQRAPEGARPVVRPGEPASPAYGLITGRGLY